MKRLWISIRPVRFRLAMIAASLVMMAAANAGAATKSATASGMWTNASIWSGGIPGAGDVAAIGTVTVTIPPAYTGVCASMTFSALASPSKVILSDGTAGLAVGGNVSIQVNSSPQLGSNELVVGAGTFSAGSVTLAGTTNGYKVTQIRLSTGIASVSGNISSAGPYSRVIVSDTGTVKVGGTLMTAATPGIFTPGSGTVVFTGTANQQIRATNFYTLAVQAGTGTVTLAGSPVIDGDLSVLSGSLDLSTFSADRSSAGGALSVGAGAGLLVSGPANFPANYATVSLNASSTVQYAHAGPQTVVVQSYGNLALSGGGAKTVPAGAAVAGNLAIAPPGSGATAALEDGMNLAVDSLTLGGLGRTNGTWGSTSSAATYKDDVFFSPSTGLLTVNTDTRTAPLVVTLPSASPIGYGQPVGLSTLSGGAATNRLGSPVVGTFAFASPAVVPETAGFVSVPVIFTPADVTTYTTAGCTVTVDVVANTWRGNGDWFTNAVNWSNGIPGLGSNVWIASGSVILTGATPALASFTMTNGTVTFSNFPAVLQASNVRILGGTVRHAANAATATNAAGEWPVSGRVYVVCTNFILQAPGLVDANQLGWSAPIGNVAGYGMGAGGTRSGGGYGGFGGSYLKTGGQPYGSLTAPAHPGSGGGGMGTARGGSGGGLVIIESPGGTVTLNGTIRADGGQGGANAGGGSGGGVFISCRTLAGANGLVTANGGDRNSTAGGGGGGRIAVAYDPAAQGNAPVCDVTFSARMGAYGYVAYPGDLGTLWFPDTILLQETVKHTGQWMAPGNVWEPASLTVTNGLIRFPAAGMRLAVAGDVKVTGAAAGLEIGGNAFLGSRMFREGLYQSYVLYSDMTNTLSLAVGGSLVLTNGGALRLYSPPTNGAPCGVLLAVTGELVVASASALYPFSDPTNGGSVCISAGNVTVLAGGTVNANMAGFGPGRVTVSNERGYGPGGGISKGGAAYGGFGGNMNNNGGRPYGDAAAPLLPGSGGGNDTTDTAGAGGGLIWISAADRLRVDGTLTANGGVSALNSGGGSGGGIYLTCTTFASTGGLVSANGVDLATTAGAGGGGRIAIAYDPVRQAEQEPVKVTLLAAGGSSVYPADLGTVWLPDGQLLAEPLNVEGEILGLSSWSGDALTVSNRWVRFPEGCPLTIAGDVTLDGSAALLDVGGSVLFDKGSFRMENTVMTGLILTSTGIASLAVGGNLVLTNGGDLRVFGGPTNAPDSYGATVTVAGAARLGAGSWVFPFSEPTNGGSALFTLGSLTAAAGSGFNADQAGFAAGGGSRTTGYGYGAGGYQCGGGYGGAGGGAVGGSVYGLSNAPAFPGSGGGRGNTTLTGANGGLGGGLIRLDVAGNILLDGTLTAVGRNSAAGGGSAGGSGGGIFVQCRKISGGGTLSAKGGNGISGGSSGGGGRIAVVSYSRAGFTGPASAPAGITGNLGATGTVVWLDRRLPGTVMMIR